MSSLLLHDYKRFQSTAVKAYLFAQKQEDISYKQTLMAARQIVCDVKQQINEEEFQLFVKAAARCIDVLQKCKRLGLINLEKRVAEYHLDEIIEQGLKKDPEEFHIM